MTCQYHGCTNIVPSVRHKYCSAECRVKVAKERNREEIDKKAKEREAQRAKVENIPCVECGNLFTPNRKTQIRCSDKCRLKGKKERLKQDRIKNPVDNDNYKKYLKRGTVQYAGYGKL